jgi:hypothetical protein
MILIEAIDAYLFGDQIVRGDVSLLQRRVPGKIYGL